MRLRGGVSNNVWTNASGAKCSASDKSVTSPASSIPCPRPASNRASAASRRQHGRLSGPTSTARGGRWAGRRTQARTSRTSRELCYRPASVRRRGGPLAPGLAQHAESSAQPVRPPHGGLRWTSRRGSRGDPQRAEQAGASRAADAHAATVRDSPRRTSAGPPGRRRSSPARAPARPNAVATQGRRFPSLQLAEELETSYARAVPASSCGQSAAPGGARPRLHLRGAFGNATAASTSGPSSPAPATTAAPSRRQRLRLAERLRREPLLTRAPRASASTAPTTSHSLARWWRSPVGACGDQNVLADASKTSSADVIFRPLPERASHSEASRCSAPTSRSAS